MSGTVAKKSVGKVIFRYKMKLAFIEHYTNLKITKLVKVQV